MSEGVEEGNGSLAGHAMLAKLAWAMRSEGGDVRPHNEDCAGVYAPTIPDDAWDRGPLFVVADGMGGHAAGEVASRVAVETALSSWSEGSPVAPSAAVRAVFRSANAAILDAALETKQKGMGTTMTALTLAGKEAVIAHVGDSRAYLVRGEQCLQLTTDHSRVAELVRMHMITPEQAATHPARSMLTRSLGAELSVQVDVVKHDVQQADAFLLCSDGLWDTISTTDMSDVLGRIGSDEVPTQVEAADQLIDLAIKRGAADNVTAVVVRVTSDRPIPAAAARRTLFRRRG